MEAPPEEGKGQEEEGASLDPTKAVKILAQLTWNQTMTLIAEIAVATICSYSAKQTVSGG